MTAHDIAEYDDVRMLTDLGYDVFSIGAYTDPRHPKSDLRPALDLDGHPDLAEACEEQRQRHQGDPMEEWIAGQLHHIVDWAKADLSQKVIDWADVIVVHHYLESWVYRQRERLSGKRVIWRTCGQSNAKLEETMATLPVEIIRYSPKESEAFTRLGVFAGEDALIRFGKYPDDYGSWIGDELVVGNVTQNMAERGMACGLYHWLGSTEGLPVKPAGSQSEALAGGIGGLSYPAMIEYLRHVRTYLYTGTQPASYTLGLIEAMLTGVPIVSMPADEWWVPDLFEGPDLVGLSAGPDATRSILDGFLRDRPSAERHGESLRQKALDLFDVAKVGPQWRDFLGAPTTIEWAHERATVTA